MLVEGPARKREGQLFGRSRQFKAVVFPDDGSRVGTLQRVRVIGATSNTLLGEPAGTGSVSASLSSRRSGAPDRG